MRTSIKLISIFAILAGLFLAMAAQGPFLNDSPEHQSAVGPLPEVEEGSANEGPGVNSEQDIPTPSEASDTTGADDSDNNSNDLTEIKDILDLDKIIKSKKADLEKIFKNGKAKEHR